MNAMEKTYMKAKLVKLYNDNSATHNYIFTITVNGMKQACYCKDFTMLDAISYYDNSRQQLKFRPNTKQKLMLMSIADCIKPLCTAKEFKAEKAKPVLNAKGEYKVYNNGETGERLVTEREGQVWVKDNVEWWNDGDITIDGVKWQIKDENNATFCHMGQVEKCRGQSLCIPSWG